MKQVLCFGDSNTWGYDGNLTSKQNGSVGGYMVKKMIEAQERQMSGSSQGGQQY